MQASTSKYRDACASNKILTGENKHAEELVFDSALTPPPLQFSILRNIDQLGVRPLGCPL